MGDRAKKAEMLAERERREKEREEFKRAQELESLRRAFKRLDKNSDGSIDCDELLEELKFLQYALRPSEAALTIWEVDDDADGKVDWEEFKGMFYRIRDDTTGYEPRKLFNVVEFIMHDKNLTGSIDVDEAVTILYPRFGKENVEQAMREIKLEEKSMSFTSYVKIQASAQKMGRTSGLKDDATMVPQVKELVYGKDPTLAHLM